MNEPTISIEELSQLWWKWLIWDKRLVEAYALSFIHAGPTWRNYSTTAFLNCVQTYVDDSGRKVPPDAVAIYERSSKVICIGNSIMDEPIEVLAAILAHELAHAVSIRHYRLSEVLGTREEAALRLEEEMEAEWWSAHIYACVPHGDRETVWTRSYDNLLTYYREDRLAEWVMRFDGWQRYCFGRVLDVS